MKLEEVEGLGGLQGGTGGLFGSSPLPQPEPPLLLPLLLLLWWLSPLPPPCWPRPRPWPYPRPPGSPTFSSSLVLPPGIGGNSSLVLSLLQGWGLESELSHELGLLLPQG